MADQLPTVSAICTLEASSHVEDGVATGEATTETDKQRLSPESKKHIKIIPETLSSTLLNVSTRSQTGFDSR